MHLPFASIYHAAFDGNGASSFTVGGGQRGDSDVEFAGLSGLPLRTHMQNGSLTEVMQRFDRSDLPITEFAIDSALRELVGDPEAPVPVEVLAERTAFSFHEREPTDGSSTYRWFAPLFSGRNEDGSGWEWPSVHKLDAQTIQYWQARATQASNPVLRARYAGLVWEFGQRVTGARPGVEFAHVRIDAVVEMADADRHERESDVLLKLGQVLDLAIGISDRPRIERVRDTIIAYEKKVASKARIAACGAGAFDLLYENKKALLTDTQRRDLVDDLEERLDRIAGNASDEAALDLFGALEAADRLARHYRRSKQPHDVRRVVLKVEDAFTSRRGKLPPLVAQAWCNRIEQRYRQFELHEDAARLRIVLRDLGRATHAALKTLEHTMRIPTEKMNAYVDSVLAGGS
jgi:hypothetical protein